MDKRNFYINGQWVKPSQPNDFTVINPATEEACATISLGSQADTDAAVAAARKAFNSWSQTSVATRIELLETIYEQYKKHSDDLIAAISMEMGAPMTLSREQQFTTGVGHIKKFITTLKDFEFETPIKGFETERVIREAIGVVGLITPWNWPMNQICLKVIPAIGVGCSTILKPSEISPLSGIVFAEIMDAAGVPAGVFNLLNGDGLGVGTQLSSHKDVDMISFTGSTRAGRAITIAAAETVKRVTLELGGKGANIVFADADKDAVMRGTKHVFNNTGQSCNAPTRMLVERSIYDSAVEIATKTANDVIVNDPSVEGAHMGPLVSEAQFNKVQGLIEQGIKEGARLIAGGLGRPDGLNKGYFARPTVFADVNNDMVIAREEVFGPVLVMIPFDSEEEAISIANDTDYGLTNYVQTGDVERARRVSRAFRSGMVRVNGDSGRGPSPFGGYKQSGNGREGGAWGLEDYLEVKHVTSWEF